MISPSPSARPPRRAQVDARRLTARFVALVALGAALAGCSNTKAAVNLRPQSGSATASVVDGLQQVTVYVDDKDRFTPDVITVHPGQVKITLVHRGTGAPHDLQVTAFPNDFVPLVQAGGTRSATFTAPAPGSYRFVCTIHQAQGQVGTLVVSAN